VFILKNDVLKLLVLLIEENVKKVLHRFGKLEAFLFEIKGN
jgi:hypothetical protein